MKLALGSSLGGITAPGPTHDPLTGIPGLRRWYRTAGVYQDSGGTLPAHEGDAVGGWLAADGSLFYEDGAHRFNIEDGWIGSPDSAPWNGDMTVTPKLLFPHTRVAEWSIICRMKFNTYDPEHRFFYVDYEGLGMNGPVGGQWLRLITELVSWSGNQTAIALGSIHTVRLQRYANGNFLLYLDGNYVTGMTSVPVADPYHGILLTAGRYAGICFAERVLSPGEIAQIENHLSTLDP